MIHRALSAETCNGRPAAIELDALNRLIAYPWPGNIRELRNVIRTALAISEGGVVRLHGSAARDPRAAATECSG